MQSCGLANEQMRSETRSSSRQAGRTAETAEEKRQGEVVEEGIWCGRDDIVRLALDRPHSKPIRGKGVSPQRLLSTIIEYLKFIATLIIVSAK